MSRTLRWGSWSLYLWGSLAFCSGKFSACSHTALSIFLFSVNSHQPVREYISYSDSLWELRLCFVATLAYFLRDTLFLGFCLALVTTVSLCHLVRSRSLSKLVFPAPVQKDWPEASLTGNDPLPYCFSCLNRFSLQPHWKHLCWEALSELSLRTLPVTRWPKVWILNAQLLCR